MKSRHRQLKEGSNDVQTMILKAIVDCLSMLQDQQKDNFSCFLRNLLCQFIISSSQEEKNPKINRKEKMC